MCKRLISAMLCLSLIFCLALPVRAEEAEQEKTTLSIASMAQFLSFAKLCRLDSYSQGLTVSLDTDLDLTNVKFESIPIFCGTFLGNNHTIRGLKLEAEGSVQGLFRYLTNTAEVRDLHLEGSVHPSGSGNKTGALAGSNAGSIQNCSVAGDLSGNTYVGGLIGVNTVTGVIEDCRMEGSVSGSHFVGGIAGDNSGVIRGCQNNAVVNITAKQNQVELSDITLESMTNSESVNTVTNIGGIAGNSVGVIRGCVNRGDVGYQQMGYNIGGIAGTQSGYLVDCVNYGRIQGRKEVGGIVGQMEPTTLIEYEEDALQILQRQLKSLGSIVNETASNVQGGAYGMYAQVDALRDHITGAEDALLGLLPTEEDPIPDLDAIQAAESALSSSFSGMTDTLRGMSATTESMVGTLSNNLHAIQNQMGAMQATLGNAEETLGGSITDVSDEDTQDNVTGKVAECGNYGEISGDLNVGGIAGAMAVENDLDHEDDLQILGENSLNFSSEMRCVLLDCLNEGNVTGKKQNAGGIVGWQSLGLVKNSHNEGSLDAEAADYVGGVAGQAEGYLRSCGAKCEIRGANYVGGIAGSATLATDCLSMVRIQEGNENVGAVLGQQAESLLQQEETPVLGNVYLPVGKDRGGIDGISYSTMAEPVDGAAFQEREGLPELFTSVTVRFRYENGGETRFDLVPGSAFPAEKIPPIPEKEGCQAKWKDLELADLNAVAFDMTFEAEYISYDGVLASGHREGVKPLILLQGGFATEAELEVTEWEDLLPVEEGQTVLKAKGFRVSNAQFLSGIRFCIYDLDPQDLGLLLLGQDGTWRQAEAKLDGSYLVAALAEGDQAVALVQRDSFPWIYAGVGGILALGILLFLLKKRKQ